uniref:Uncharacterized protein n=1 Tax=Oscillatoriales cyanobacterium SpSt-418 TaxID=2282169 RepID=A0A7C3PI09_9CYAN
MTVDDPVQFTEAIWGDQRAPFDSVTRNFTLNLESGPCSGEQFAVEVRFNLNNSSSCCQAPPSSVVLQSDNKFELLGNPQWTDSRTSGNVLIILKRRSDGGGTKNKVFITVTGFRTDGKSYSSQGNVILNCP